MFGKIEKITFGILFLLFLTCCGLGEDPRDEDDKYLYLRIADPAFERYLLERWDSDGDGRLSRYEARRVVEIDCSALGIKTLAGIESFTSLRRLVCCRNEIVALDVRKCVLLQELDCSENQLIELAVGGLRSLYRLDCRKNELTYLDLGTSSALSEFRCGDNLFVTLDVGRCAAEMVVVDTSSNPGLMTLYKRVGQWIQTLDVDGWTKVEEL